MTRSVTVAEAQAIFPQLLAEVAQGREIEIIDGGRPVARLVPPLGARTLKGSFAGIVRTTASDEELFSPRPPWTPEWKEH